MIFGREIELQALNTAYDAALRGHGSVLFLTGEAGLGKTTLVHEWWNLPEDRERRAEEIFSPQSDSVIRSHSSSLFLEAACSIPIGNVDVGRLEALQPWADVIAGISDFELRISDKKEKSIVPEVRDSKSEISVRAHGRAPLQKIDVKKLAKDSASSWALAVPLVGGLAHAAIETSRLVKEQRELSEKINLKQLIHDAAPAWAWALPVVGDVLHAAAETARLAHEQKHGSTEQNFNAQNQQQVFQQYVNLLTKISEETLLVIFLDDLHWADASSCNLLFYLSRQITDKKILVIGTYREDDALTANDGKGHPILRVKNEILRYESGKEIVLGSLTLDAIHQLLTSSTESAESAHSTASQQKFEQWLHNISSGNSLFVSQYLKTLREDGLLSDNGEFTGDYANVRVPPTALAVVEERTRRLDEPTRKLLMYATAEGEEFTTYVLERIAKRDPIELLEELQKATTLGLITPRGTNRLYANATTGIFGFSHALFHKALYDGLLDIQKIHLHRQCFALLKTEWDRLSETKQRSTTLATKLMMHAEKCEEWETVANVALEAGRIFWKTFNEDESRAMVARVLAACDAADGFTLLRADAMFLEAQIEAFRGQHNEAIEHYGRAEKVFRHAGAAERAVDTVNGQSGVYEGHSLYDASLLESSRALSEARDLGYHKGEAVALLAAGVAHYFRGALEDALARFEQCLVIESVIGNRLGEAGALNNIGSVHRERGAYDAALTHFEKSLAMYAAVGNRLGEAKALNNIGLVRREQGAYDEAMAQHEKSLAIFVAIGNRYGEASVLNNLGSVQLFCGAHDAALTQYKKSLAIHSAIGNRRGEANALLNIGIVEIDRGASNEALAHTEQSLAIHIAIGNRLGEANARMHIGKINRLGGRLNEARTYFERCLAIAAEISARSIIGTNSGELGLLCEAESRTLAGDARESKRAEALRLAADAIEKFRELKQETEIAKWEKELERMEERIKSEF